MLRWKDWIFAVLSNFYWTGQNSWGIVALRSHPLTTDLTSFQSLYISLHLLYREH